MHAVLHAQKPTAPAQPPCAATAIGCVWLMTQLSRVWLSRARCAAQDADELSCPLTLLRPPSSSHRAPPAPKRPHPTPPLHPTDIKQCGDNKNTPSLLSITAEKRLEDGAGVGGHQTSVTTGAWIEAPPGLVTVYSTIGIALLVLHQVSSLEQQ